MMSEQEKVREEIVADEKETPIVPGARRTGQGARSSDVKEGAEPEAPGNKNTEVPGSPNQGTEAR